MLSKIVQLLYTFAQHSIMVIRALKLICSAVTHRSTRHIGKNNWLQKAEFSNQRATLGVLLFACFSPFSGTKTPGLILLLLIVFPAKSTGFNTEESRKRAVFTVWIKQRYIKASKSYDIWVQVWVSESIITNGDFCPCWSSTTCQVPRSLHIADHLASHSAHIRVLNISQKLRSYGQMYLMLQQLKRTDWGSFL